MRQSSSTALNVPGAEDMRSIGRALGAALRIVTAGALVITIEGELGAGKTTLVGGVLDVLGVKGPIRSPTYTLIEPYEAAGLYLYHIDLYRLAGPEEVEPLALRDLLTASTVLLIEWPSRATDRLPGSDLHVTIEYAPEQDTATPGRLLTLRAGSSAGDRLVERILAAKSE